MFKIGDFSRLTRVSVRMLRHYDEIGLLKPETIDPFSGYRFYSVDQMTKVHRIQVLKEIGFTLAEIGSWLEKDLDAEQMRNLLTLRKREISDAIDQEKEKLLRVDAMLTLINKEDLTMNYDINIKKIPAFKVLALRDTIPNYAAEGRLWEELGTFAGMHHLKCQEPSYAIYHDEGYKDSDVDIEVVMGISEPVESTDRIKVRELEEIPEAAVIFHQGPFEDLSTTYHALGKWMNENQYRWNGPTRAIYHKGPWNESNPSNYLTEIHAPVTKIK